MKYEKTLVVALLYLCKGLAGEQQSCDTPSGKRGQCISIRKCSPLYALIMKRPISKVNSDLLNKSKCGLFDSVPKICCPNESVTNTDFLPDDVLSDPESNVLPDPADCGISTDKRIVGGEMTDLDEFPWLALINIENSNTHRQAFGCGGVIISKRYVLTAAHCLTGMTKHWTVAAVRLGEYNKDSDEDCYHNGFKKVCLSTPPIDVRIEEKIPHEKFDPKDPNRRHDVGLLRLSKDVNFTTDYIKPICLPLLEEERKKTYVGYNLTVAGWGQTENGSLSSVKLKLHIPVSSNTYCNSLYKHAEKNLGVTQLCAGGIKDMDACKGDSGGPLMTVSKDQHGDSTWYAAGIVSYGPEPCGLEGWPAVYTRVTKYLGWIVRHMKP